MTSKAKQVMFITSQDQTVSNNTCLENKDGVKTAADIIDVVEINDSNDGYLPKNRKDNNNK